MPTEYSWPRLRSLLDQAISSERGITVKYDSWSVAERVRSNMYKIRDTQRRESRKVYPDPMHPSHGVSAYDGIIFWLRSTISRRDQEVVFSDGSIAQLPDDPIGAKKENENLFPGRTVTVSVTTEKGRASVKNAPSYKEAWDILRRDFPCYLVMENGYNTDHLEIHQL